MIQQVIRDLLLSDNRIKYFIDTRIYPLRAPEKTEFPLITMQVYDTDITHSKDGDERTDRVQFLLGVWSKDYHESQKIYNLIRQILADFKNPDIITITLTRTNETYDQIAKAYGVNLHFEITARFLELSTDEHWDFLLTEEDKKVIFD